MRRGEEARSRRRLRNRGAVARARFSSCAYIVSSLCPEVIVGLELKRFGLELYSTDALNFVMGRRRTTSSYGVTPTALSVS